MSRLIKFFEQNVRDIIKERFFLTIVTCTMLEYVFFVLLVHDDNAEVFDFDFPLLGLPSFLLYISFAVIPYFFVFFLPGIWQRITMVVINFSISIFLIFDLWYFRNNSNFLNFYMFDMAGNLNGLLESIIAMLRFADLFFLSIPILLIALLVRNLRKKERPIRNYKLAVLLLIIPILYISYDHIKIDTLNRGYENQVVFKKLWTRTYMMHNLTPLGYHLYDIAYYFQDLKPFTLSKNNTEKIKQYYKSKEKGLEKNEYFGMFKGYNLFVLQVESLENFVINETVNGQEVTPNLNKLLDNAFYFSNYIEHTYNGVSSDSTFTSNNSMYPPINGSHNFKYTYNDYNSLPKLLKKSGYTTYSMHPEEAFYWNWFESEKHMGFDNCFDSFKFNRSEYIGLGLSDMCFLSQLDKKVEKQKEPYYSLSLTLTSHTPFDIPEKYQKFDLPENFKKSKVGKYLQAINYTDRAIGKMIENFNNKNLLDKTVIAIYGDHEGPNNFFNNEMKNLEGVPKDWSKNNKRVPLILYSKDIEGKEISVYGGQVDFLPTICYLFGIEEEEYVNTAIGRNLLNTKLNRTVTTGKIYYGDEKNKSEKEKDTNAIDICDLIIRSNYFKNYKSK